MGSTEAVKGTASRLEFDARSLERAPLRAWSLTLGAWSLTLGAWSLTLGVWSLTLGAWSVEFGV